MYVHILIKAISVISALLTPLWYDYESVTDIWLPIAILLGTYIVLGLMFWGTIVLFSLTMSKTKAYTDVPGGFYGKLFNFIFDCICSYARIDIRTTGLASVPKEPFMLVCNHRSRFDNMVISTVLKRKDLIFISKPGNFDIPICGRYMNRCSYLPIDHYDTRSAMRTVNKAAALIKERNASVGIFPEGKRNPPDHLGDFSEGCFLMAKKAECPIVICTVSGTEKVCKRFPFRSTSVDLHFLGSVPYSEIKERRTGDISAKIHDVMNKDLFGEGDSQNEICNV